MAKRAKKTNDNATTDQQPEQTPDENGESTNALPNVDPPENAPENPLETDTGQLDENDDGTGVNGGNAEGMEKPPTDGDDPEPRAAQFVCDCGTEMDILKRSPKRRFDMKNKVTYYDAMQCHCPKCHRVKEFEV